MNCVVCKCKQGNMMYTSQIAFIVYQQEYLLKVLEAEIDYRNTKRKKLHLKQAGFDNLKTFEGYDFDHIVIPNTTSIDGIKTLDFMSRNENLILYGRNGAGKSHMATAIGVEACIQRKR